jgi:hypothetical protein
MKGIIMVSKTVWMVCAAAVLLGGCAHQQKISLLSGNTLDGWQPVLEDSTVDPAAVWSVSNGVLRCEGKPKGYLRTTESYANYRLHVEWRWPEKPTNSGVLLHVTGPDKIWPQCLEAQLMNQNAGDFIAMGETSFAEKKEKNRVPKLHDTNEKEAGQWNCYDITCDGDTITLAVNGLLQNTATKTSLSVGTIALQSEGSPIEFRNITLTPLKRLLHK